MAAFNTARTTTTARQDPYAHSEALGHRAQGIERKRRCQACTRPLAEHCVRLCDSCKDGGDKPKPAARQPFGRAATQGNGGITRVGTETQRQGGQQRSYVPPSKRFGAGQRATEGSRYNRHEREEHSLRITNLNEECTQHDIQTLCRRFGRTRRVNIPQDRTTGRSRGVCYVDFHREADAAQALEALDGAAFGNTILRVEWANGPSRQQQPRHQRYGPAGGRALPSHSRGQQLYAPPAGPAPPRAKDALVPKVTADSNAERKKKERAAKATAKAQAVKELQEMDAGRVQLERVVEKHPKALAAEELEQMGAQSPSEEEEPAQTEPAARHISPPRSAVAQLADSLLPELRELEVGADWSRKVAKVARQKRLEEEDAVALMLSVAVGLAANGREILVRLRQCTAALEQLVDLLDEEDTAHAIMAGAEAAARFAVGRMQGSATSRASGSVRLKGVASWLQLLYNEVEGLEEEGIAQWWESRNPCLVDGAARAFEKEVGVFLQWLEDAETEEEEEEE